MVAVHTDAEGICRRTPVSADTRETRLATNGKVAKSDAQGRCEHYSNAVDAIERPRPAAADDCLAAAKKRVQQTVAVIRIPGQRQPRTPIGVVGIVRIFASGCLDGDESERGVEYVAVQRCRRLCAEIIV